ncbi:hypothetical protein GCM10027592_58950 [Spirosoma flavus]
MQLRELLNLPNVVLIDVYFNWYAIELDPDDNKFVDCSVACGADYLVTNDRHFNVLSNIDFPKVITIRAEDFLLVLNSTIS